MYAGHRNYWATRQRASRQIEKYGMAAVLRRVNAPDRWVILEIQDYMPEERIGKMIDPVDRLAIVKASPELDKVPPDRDLDRVITFVQPMGTPPVQYEVLKITAPVDKIAPGGIVLYWSLQVRA
jgi:hypothetical protein